MATTPVEKGTSSKSEAKTLGLSELDDLLLSKDGEVVSVSIFHLLPSPPNIFYAYPEARLEAQGPATSINLKPQVVDGRERLRMIDHPIPVRLLQVSSEQTRQAIFGCIPLGKTCYQLHFSPLGKQFNKGKALTLLCSTAEASKSWTEAINAQRDANQQSADSSVLRLGQDMLKGNGEIKVNCATLYDNDQIIAYGTGDGVYFQPQNGRPRKAIDLTDVRHIEVLEDLSLLVVRA
ncbi:hypothetical protein RSAG8_13875, partial [Rhizoctonia solani AG-8 WAC10335]